MFSRVFVYLNSITNENHQRMSLLGSATLIVLFCMTTNIGQVIENLQSTGKHGFKLFSNFHERIEATKLPKSKVLASHRLQTVVDASIPFPCSVNNGRSKSRPISVHMLRPGDIDVVGSIGDSMTAGVGTLTTNILNMLDQHRGVSYIIGGEKTWREYMTLPNIIKEFNPNLIGYSLASSQTRDPRSQFNPATSGALSANLPQIAIELIGRMKSEKRVNITSDWKHISISMGANDFCSYSCIGIDPYAVLEKHRLDLVRTLRLLRDNLPRTFVNLIPPPDVLIVKQLNTGGIVCTLAHKIECQCAILPQFQFFVSTLADIMKKWVEIEISVSMYEEFNRNDFTVEVHPIFEKLPVPRTENGDVDYSYFSVDCFHFSQKTHAILAVLAWNGLFSCKNEKWDFKAIFYENMKCPTEESPYLITKKNTPSCQ